MRSGLPERRRALEELGFETIMSGPTRHGGDAYLQAPDILGHTIVEPVERAGRRP